MKKKILTIDRSKWVTGNTGIGQSALLNEDGFMCCLGFECRRLGLSEKDIFHNVAPDDAIKSFKNKFRHLLTPLIPKFTNSEFSDIAMRINDNHSTYPKVREKKIKTHFKTVGITVRFVGKYAKKQ